MPVPESFVLIFLPPTDHPHNLDMAPVAISPSPVPLNVGTYPHILKNGPTTTPATAAPSSGSSVSTSATQQPISSLSTTQPWRPKQVDPPKRTAFSFDSMPEALEAFEKGEFLVVMDDENRENEGDLIIAASQCTPEKMAWMIKHTRFVSPSLTSPSITHSWLLLTHCHAK